MLSHAGSPTRVSAVRYSPCGRWLAAAGDIGVVVWEAGRPDHPHHHLGGNPAVEAAFPGRYLLVARLAGGGAYLDRLRTDFEGFPDPYPIRLGPADCLDAADGRLLIGRPGVIGCRTVPDGEGWADGWQLALRPNARPWRAALLPDGGVVAVEGLHWSGRWSDFNLVRWDVDGSPVARVRLPTAAPRQLAVGGGRLVVNRGRAVLVWPLARLADRPRKLTRGFRFAADTAVHPNGDTALLADTAGLLTRLDLGTGTVRASYAVPGKPVAVAVSPDGLTAAVCTAAGAVIAYDLD
jgi:hypothetical protein